MTNPKQHDNATLVVALVRFAGMPPRLVESLVVKFGSLETIVRASTDDLMAMDGMTAEFAEEITAGLARLPEAEEYCRSIKSRDIHISTRFDDDYYHRFFELNDPPPLLYVRGKLPDRDRKTVALVGTRSATNEGIELTIKVAKAMVENEVQVISSLRKGIDAAAHLGVRATEAGSFAVIDSGFDHIDAKEEMPLAIDVAHLGGVITEHSPERKPGKKSFEASNRIVAALSQAVVVTEVYDDSRHTMDLLRCCSQIGKMVFFVIDPRHGALATEKSLKEAVTHGAIPMVGLDKLDDIAKSLV